MSNRFDCVFIRKSTYRQDDKGQADNVRAMLKDLGVQVPAERWFVGTVSRTKVRGNESFNQLIDLVEANQVGTIYVEAQDRWGDGTKETADLFGQLKNLRDHGTQLFDLRAKKDLTGREFMTELEAMFNAYKSRQELKDLASRSLRTKVSLHNAGSWPSGIQPFGYGKAVYDKDGTLLWVWQPDSRWRGRLYYPDADGNLPEAPARSDVPIPKKDKGQRQRTLLIPSDNPDAIKAVQLAFDLFVRCGMSRRQICRQLNEAKLYQYGKPWTHAEVKDLLEKPAYCGDTVFGRRQGAAYQSFDAKGLIVPANGKLVHRDLDQCLVQKDTHDPLVDRKTWERAQEQLASLRLEQDGKVKRNNLSPRNPNHYLKQLLVCGHCGRGMTGKTENKNGKSTPCYVCMTYHDGQSACGPVSCGYHRITHEDAERLLLDKVRELNLPFSPPSSQGARASLEERLERLGTADKESLEAWWKWLREGVKDLIAYLSAEHPEIEGYPQTRRLHSFAYHAYTDDREEGSISLPDGKKLVVDLKKAVKEVEGAAVVEAKKKLTELDKEHAALTRSWAKATPAMQKVLKEDIEVLESQKAVWQARTLPLSQRLRELHGALAERQAEREKVLEEWPDLELRERGEALRRLFSRVTLYWEKEWKPASLKPSRPQTTQRLGRWTYKLLTDRIEYALPGSGPDSSTSRAGGTLRRTCARPSTGSRGTIWSSATPGPVPSAPSASRASRARV
jgi:hypothetical protein